MPVLVSYVEPDGSSRFEERARIPTLTELQQAVGGYIECVHVYINHRRAQMWVNEEGKLIGLPINPVASKIAHCTIVGTAVIVQKG